MEGMGFRLDQIALSDVLNRDQGRFRVLERSERSGLNQRSSTMKRFFLSTCLAATFAVSAQAAEIGVTNFTFDAPNRDRLVQAVVTYPAESGGYTDYVGDNIVFNGMPMKRDAKPVRKKHPLVIFSHGSGGSAANAAWLTAALAQAGYVVIAPNHQGSTSADSTPETTIPAVWERKRDMTALLDAVAASASISSLVNMDDVTAIGFSLGGQTVLSLGGLQMNATAIAEFCDQNPEQMPCIWFARGNPLIPGHVDLHKIDKTKFEEAYRELRVKRVIAIDPAFVPAFNRESLKSITVPVQIINLGSADEVPVTVDARPVMNDLQNAKLEFVEGANHFSFVSECKLAAPLLIWFEGDDPVCQETGNRSRAEYHEEILKRILTFLGARDT
jgi:predicted dienelactone hydrolase